MIAHSAAFILVITGAGSAASAAEQLHQLHGREIQSSFSGKELTDESHWGMIFAKNGKLSSSEAGTGLGSSAPDAKVGRWQVQKDQLCVDLVGGHICYVVFAAGKRAILRYNGEDVLDGIVRAPVR